MTGDGGSVRKVAYSLAPGELAALAQREGAPAGLTDDQAYDWFRVQNAPLIDLITAALAKAMEETW